jgi:hypothetical protein
MSTNTHPDDDRQPDQSGERDAYLRRLIQPHVPGLIDALPDADAVALLKLWRRLTYGPPRKRRAPHSTDT